jgi:hypothetical protein
MWRHLFDGFNLIHGVLLVLAAVASFRFWVRTRFWFPRYIHVLAPIGFAISIWVASAMPTDAPAGKAGLIGRILVALHSRPSFTFSLSFMVVPAPPFTVLLETPLRARSAKAPSEPFRMTPTIRPRHPGSRSRCAQRAAAISCSQTGSGPRRSDG